MPTPQYGFWTQVATSGATQLPPRLQHSSVLVGTDALFVIGGNDKKFNAMTDTWRFNLTTNTWSQVSKSGFHYSLGHSSVYLASKGLIYTICGLLGDSSGINYSTVHTLSPASLQWQLLAPATNIVARNAHSAVAVGEKIFVIAGQVSPMGSGTALLSDVWIFDANAVTWSLASPSGGPFPGRFQHSSAYDSATDKILTFGGYTCAEFGATCYLSDLWSLHASSLAWTQIAFSGQLLGLGGHSSLVFGDKLYIFCGKGRFYNNSVWNLPKSDGEAVQVTATGSLPARSLHSSVFDQSRSLVFLFGGYGSTSEGSVGAFSDLWTFSLTAPTLAPTAPTANPTLEPSANPTENPTLAPTAPTETPTFAPTAPTANPTSRTPTLYPSKSPSRKPTFSPFTPSPTVAPSSNLKYKEAYTLDQSTIIIIVVVVFAAFLVAVCLAVLYWFRKKKIEEILQRQSLSAGGSTREFTEQGL